MWKYEKMKKYKYVNFNYEDISIIVRRYEFEIEF